MAKKTGNETEEWYATAKKSYEQWDREELHKRIDELEKKLALQGTGAIIYKALDDRYQDALEACRAVMEWSDSGCGNDYSFMLKCRAVVEKEDDGS